MVIVNAALLRRKLKSGLVRLRLARQAIVAGGRTAITGVMESFDLSGGAQTNAIAGAAPDAVPTLPEPALEGATIAPPPVAAPFPPEPPQADKTMAFALTLAELQMRPPPRVRPRTPRPKRVVMFGVAQLRIDPRVEREARALVEAGFEVVVVGPDLSEPSNAQVPLNWGPNITFDLLPGMAVGFMVNAPWFYSAPLVKAGSAHEAFAYHAHDLWTALIALDCASRTGALAVMDYHEWTSENVSWDAVNLKWAPHPAERADAFRNMENLGMRLAALTITVNQTIATALEEEAGLPPGTVSIIRNVPKLDAVPTKVYPPLKQQFGLPDSAFVVLYQGGTGPSRLLEPVIEGMAHAPGAVLIIRGPSLDLFGDDYRALATRCGVADRVILAPAVPSHDVVAAARGADLGLYTVVDASKNFRYALPNKVFEYLAADVPLAIADYPEVLKIITEHKCGVSFNPHDPRSIGAAIHSVQTDRKRFAELRRNVPIAFKALDGASEWERFAALYDGLWRRATTPDPT
jgi:glycosyltransferase involved in cell wall biosynthesis